MFDFLGKTVAKIFGSKSDRDLKEIVPYVALINAEYANLAQLSDDELRARTDEVRARIDAHLKGNSSTRLMPWKSSATRSWK
jgi:preprotein translocase subunit SecA